MAGPRIPHRWQAARFATVKVGKPNSWQLIAILLGRVRLIGQEAYRAFRLDQRELANRTMGQ